jgi:hypothetical protein
VRFEPDTWSDALWRPIAMAAPDANVYVEIMAPDFRFVFVLGLLGMLAMVSFWRRGNTADMVRRGAAAGRPVAILVFTLGVAYAAWLATTGNGRYFVAGLLLVGPVCVALAWTMPASKGARLMIAAGMVALQAFAVQQSAPWRAWTLASWREPPYFHVDLPRGLQAEPATYVTMSAISYSLLAPLFHPDSRWANLHNAPPPGRDTAGARRTAAFLSQAQAGRLMLLIPAVPGSQAADLLPDPAVTAALSNELAAYGLQLTLPRSCAVLPSRSLASMGLGEKTQAERERSVFWLCHLARLETATVQRAPPRRYDGVFKALETRCPRLFHPGGDRGTLVLPNGEMRSYLLGEMKVYAYDSGEVYYKYYRALNPVLVGRGGDVAAGRFAFECDRIRGRSGLPWERGF